MAPFEPLSAGVDSLQIIDPVLSQIAVQYRPHGFVYSQVVNSFPVEMNIGQYPEFNRAGFFASNDGRPVADDAVTPLVDFEYSEKFYHCKDYRKKIRLTRKELQQAHPALRITESKVIGLLDVFAGEREKRLAERLMPFETYASVANSTGQLLIKGIEPGVGGATKAKAKWSEGKKAVYEASIQGDVAAAKKVVYEKTGIWPNTLIITQQIAEEIALDATLKTQIQYALGLRQISEGVGILPEKLFGLNVVIADGALTNTAAAGGTTNLEEIWGKHARVLYVNPNPTWGTPSVAYGFRGKVTDGFSYATPAVAEGGPGGVTQQEPGGMAQWTVVDRWAEPDPPAENIRVWECVDERIVGAELGAVIENVI